MIKYWNYQGACVVFDGSKTGLVKFEKENLHLNGHDCSQADYAESRSVEAVRAKKHRKRKKILEIADHDKQFQMIFDCLAKLQLNGVDISTEVSSFLGKRSQVK